MRHDTTTLPRPWSASYAALFVGKQWKGLSLVGVSILMISCKKPSVVKPPPPVVEVREMQLSEVPLSTTLIGQLDSPQNVEIRARVEGIVDQMPFTEGVEIKQGDLLFTLDRKPFIERLAAANGMLAEAEASLRKYEADVARLQPLYEKSAIPKQDLDNAKAGVEVGQAGLQSAKARVETAQLDLSYCEIKAPISGLIGAKMVSMGELVGRGEPTLLATMSTLDPIWFYSSVSEVEYLKAVENGKTVGREFADLPLTLLLHDGKEHAEKGRFVFIDRAVNAKTGTLRIRAEFPNPAKTLRPGMFARVRVDIGTRKECLQVPERALLEIQGKAFLWSVDAENKCHMQRVKLGEKHGSSQIILEGVKVGEHIIVEGIQKARDGAPVTAMTAAQLAAAKAAHKLEAQPAH